MGVNVGTKSNRKRKIDPDRKEELSNMTARQRGEPTRKEELSNMTERQRREPIREKEVSNMTARQRREPIPTVIWDGSPTGENSVKPTPATRPKRKAKSQELTYRREKCLANSGKRPEGKEPGLEPYREKEASKSKR